MSTSKPSKKIHGGKVYMFSDSVSKEQPMLNWFSRESESMMKERDVAESHVAEFESRIQACKNEILRYQTFITHVKELNQLRAAEKVFQWPVEHATAVLNRLTSELSDLEEEYNKRAQNLTDLKKLLQYCSEIATIPISRSTFAAEEQEPSLF